MIARVTKIILVSVFFGAVFYYSKTLAIILFLIALLLGFCVKRSNAQHLAHMAELEEQRKAFLEKYNGSISFHTSSGKTNTELYQAHKELIATLVDEVIIDKGWKPWPLFMHIRSSVAQPFLVLVKDGQFHFRSFRKERQLYKARKLTLAEFGLSVKEAIASLKQSNNC